MTHKRRQKTIIETLMLGQNAAPALKSDVIQAQAGSAVNNLVTLTQVEYDAIDVADDATLYFIVEA